MDIKLFFCNLLLFFMGNVAASTNSFSIIPTVAMPPVQGDPGQVDVVRIMIEATGGDTNDPRLYRKGCHRFVRRLGPFEIMEIKELDESYQNPFTNRQSCSDSYVEEVTSTSAVVDVTYAHGVKRLRDVKHILVDKFRYDMFAESMSAQDGFLIISSTKPMQGVWDIVLRLDKVQCDRYIFKLRFHRRITQNRRLPPDVHVEVDI